MSLTFDGLRWLTRDQLYELLVLFGDGYTWRPQQLLYDDEEGQDRWMQGQNRLWSPRYRFTVALSAARKTPDRFFSITIARGEDNPIWKGKRLTGIVTRLATLFQARIYWKQSYTSQGPRGVWIQPIDMNHVSPAVAYFCVAYCLFHSSYGQCDLIRSVQPARFEKTDGDAVEFGDDG